MEDVSKRIKVATYDGTNSAEILELAQFLGQASGNSWEIFSEDENSLVLREFNEWTGGNYPIPVGAALVADASYGLSISTPEVVATTFVAQKDLFLAAASDPQVIAMLRLALFPELADGRTLNVKRSTESN